MEELSAGCRWYTDATTTADEEAGCCNRCSGRHPDAATAARKAAGVRIATKAIKSEDLGVVENLRV